MQKQVAATLLTVVVLVAARGVSKWFDLPYDHVMFGLLTYMAIYAKFFADEGAEK